MQVVFGLCAGPITFSIPALRNSLVLHSLDKTTSLFMHATPAVMAWCLRWHPYRYSLANAPLQSPWYKNFPRPVYSLAVPCMHNGDRLNHTKSMILRLLPQYWSPVMASQRAILLLQCSSSPFNLPNICIMSSHCLSSLVELTV